MSKYAVDKVLWEIGQRNEAVVAFDADAEAFLAGRELEDDERRALAARDLRAIFQLGCHPFLLYFFAIRIAGGWTFGLMIDYVKALEGLELLDIET
jgi:protocatechuate 4,5-dioxygenase alpha chain